MHVDSELQADMRVDKHTVYTCISTSACTLRASSYAQLFQQRYRAATGRRHVSGRPWQPQRTTGGEVCVEARERFLNGRHAAHPDEYFQTDLRAHELVHAGSIFREEAVEAAAPARPAACKLALVMWSLYCSCCAGI